MQKKAKAIFSQQRNWTNNIVLEIQDSLDALSSNEELVTSLKRMAHNQCVLAVQVMGQKLWALLNTLKENLCQPKEQQKGTWYVQRLEIGKRVSWIDTRTLGAQVGAKPS